MILYVNKVIMTLPNNIITTKFNQACALRRCSLLDTLGDAVYPDFRSDVTMLAVAGQKLQRCASGPCSFPNGAGHIDASR